MLEGVAVSVNEESVMVFEVVRAGSGGAMAVSEGREKDTAGAGVD